MRRDRRERTKRRIGSIYSWAAGSIYDRVVVNGAFRLFGGSFNEALLELSRRAGKLADGEPILDMPVGTAVFTTPAARVARGLVVGCDLAEGMVVKTAEVARRDGLENLVVVRGDAHSLPFRSGCFPVVMCFNGLQVIPDLEATVRELLRVAAPGGTLFVAAISLAVSSFGPPAVAMRMPNIISSHKKTVAMLQRSGAAVGRVELYRLGYVIEARSADAAGPDAPPR